MMSFGVGEFSTGIMGSFHPALTSRSVGEIGISVKLMASVMSSPIRNVPILTPIEVSPFWPRELRVAWVLPFFFPPFSSWMESFLAKALGCPSRTFFE
jgi:hypothetical protein